MRRGRRRSSDAWSSGIRTLLAGFLLLSMCACASKPPERLSPGPLETSTASLGAIVARFEPPAPQALRVVVIKDRHATTATFMRLRPQLREIQRSNRLIVEKLVGEGFRLLGCEKEYGELLEDENTKSQFKIVRSRLDPPDHLDQFSVYQPIRFKAMFAPRLEVFGVEDKDAYQEDVRLLKAVLALRQKIRRNDFDSQEHALAKAALAAAVGDLDKNIVRRGAKAAENLIALMNERRHEKAILLVGGAHVPAACGVFRDRGVAFEVFESRLYAAPAVEAAADDDDSWR